MSYHFLRFPGFRDRALTLSYDDGVVEDKRLIEIMSKNGLKGTFNINSGYLGHRSRLSAEEAVELYKGSGNEVAVHGVKHHSLTELDDAGIIKDIIDDREALEELFGCVITGMAYANGHYNDRVVDVIGHCGITYSRTVVSTEKFDIPKDWLRLSATCHHNNPRLMELARKFVENKKAEYYWFNKPKLFYLWGHSYEFRNDDNWNVIEEFAEYVGNRDDIWYATNGEIYEYVKAYDSLVYSVSKKYVFNPTAIDVYLDWFGHEVLVPVGQSAELPPIK